MENTMKPKQFIIISPDVLESININLYLQLPL